MFIAADRRNGKDKLQKKFVDFTNKGIKKVLEKRFNEEKEQVISKLNSLIESETEDETKKKINETKEKISSTNFSVNELIKIKELNSHLVL